MAFMYTFFISVILSEANNSLRHDVIYWLCSISDAGTEDIELLPDGFAIVSTVLNLIKRIPVFLFVCWGVFCLFICLFNLIA